MILMNPSTFYKWEMESSDGLILAQYDENGIEQTWKKLDTEKIIRVSFIPNIPLLSRHDVFIDKLSGEKFIKRFGRGFIKQKPNGFKLSEYINCCVTNRYRFWVFSNGYSMVTHKNYELRI